MRLVLAMVISLVTVPGWGAVLNGTQLQQTLVGHTVSGVEEGKSYTETYWSDGFVRGLDADGPYTGEWQIMGSRFCTRYFESSNNEEGEINRGQPSKWKCVQANLKGDNFFWVEEGENYPAQLK